MKQSKICPKCGGTDILLIEGKMGPYGSGNNIPTGWTYVKVNRYLCAKCGFSEEWVEREDVEKLRRKYGEPPKKGCAP